MKVLLLVASRHGATSEIADTIATRLRGRGHVVDVAAPDRASSATGYDAVVVGSAVYAGSWMKGARDFVTRDATALAALPVWLFSSGPLDDRGTETLSTEKLDALMSASGARDHHVFSGRLDRSDLNRAERLLTRVVHAPEGDFRDWDDVAQWSDRVADELV